MTYNGKEVFIFKTDSKNDNFANGFSLVIISDGFSGAESREVSLIGSVYNFSVDYNYIDKSDILNIY